MRKRFAILAACCCALVSCAAPDVPAPASSGAERPGATGDLPAVTDQEIDALIDTVMQGVAIPAE